jgi:chaperonin GroEL
MFPIWAQTRRGWEQNAASISALMLTTEAMICEIPEKKPAPAPGGGHEHGGGMDF